MKKVVLLFFIATLLSECSKVCPCGPGPRVAYYFFYKSATNPDLLQPETGIYSPDNVKVYEVFNYGGTISQSLAPTINGQYVFDNDAKQSGYFINYQSTVLQYQDDLEKTLIQLKPGMTDTLAYSFKASSSYPQEIFYNNKLVWKIGDPMEIIIVK